MVHPSYFTFAQVRATFRSALHNCEESIQDQELPDSCAALGRLLMRMGLDGLDCIARDHIDGLALTLLDQYVNHHLLDSSDPQTT